jgi:hypothetical protein
MTISLEIIYSSKIIFEVLTCGPDCHMMSTSPKSPNKIVEWPNMNGINSWMVKDSWFSKRYKPSNLYYADSLSLLFSFSFSLSPHHLSLLGQISAHSYP